MPSALPHNDNILAPILEDISHAVADIRSGNLASAIDDVISIPSDFYHNLVADASVLVDQTIGNSKVQFNRPRTGQPFNDGLIGVEPNPGPASSLRMKKVPKGTTPSAMKGKMKARRGAIAPSSRIASIPSLIGVSGRGAPATSYHTSTRRILGTNATVIKGVCPIQNFASNAGSSAVFQDSALNQSQFIYMNPRICCQNNSYGVPAGRCPIGVLAQPWRKFCFLKARLHYEPTSVSTASVGTVAFAYEPNAVAQGNDPSGFSTPMSIANFECSAYGPMWSPNVLDITPYLDRSRWYTGETPSLLGTAVTDDFCFQGTVILCNNTLPAVSTTYGMFKLEFEVAFYELGPTEVRSLPAFDAGGSSTSPTPKVPPQCDSVVIEEYVLVNGEKKLVNRTETNLK
jgi:hypothetical protein